MRMIKWKLYENILGIENIDKLVKVILTIIFKKVNINLYENSKRIFLKR